MIPERAKLIGVFGRKIQFSALVQKEHGKGKFGHELLKESMPSVFALEPTQPPERRSHVGMKLIQEIPIRKREIALGRRSA